MVRKDFEASISVGHGTHDLDSFGLDFDKAPESCYTIRLIEFARQAYSSSRLLHTPFTVRESPIVYLLP